MNELDFAFVNRQPIHSTFHSTGKTVRNSLNKSSEATYSTSIPSIADDDGERFLRIVAKTSKIKRHYELFQLLQGEDIQHFIPHQVMISAWGDFGGPHLSLDVVSALQGVRTGQVTGCGNGIEQPLREMIARWVAGGRRPLVLDKLEAEPILHSNCACAFHLAMRRMSSVQVHGIRNERDNLDSLYVTLNTVTAKNELVAESIIFLIENLITQLDVAFRKIPALKNVGSAAATQDSPNDDLSAREQEIVRWIAEGKTNAEIAGVLEISAFTVKNHIQRIFRKLGATNRTQAVAMCRRDRSQPH